jgi:hypothetical protein
MSNQTTESLDAKLRTVAERYRDAQRDYHALPHQTPKDNRVQSLHAWNDAADDYFTCCVAVIFTEQPRTPHTGNASHAADWLQTAADHYGALRHEIEERKLGVDFEGCKPSLLKFAGLQRLVREAEPQVAIHLRNRFITVGLPTFGFDESSPVEPEGPRIERRRWFVFGCLMFAVAVGFAAWGFYLETLSDSRRNILLWILPLSSGFAAGAFAGSITARARQPGPGLAIVATGGFAVWLLTSFLLFPRSETDGASGVSELKGDGILRLGEPEECSEADWGFAQREIKRGPDVACRAWDVSARSGMQSGVLLDASVIPPTKTLRVGARVLEGRLTEGDFVPAVDAVSKKKVLCVYGFVPGNTVRFLVWYQPSGATVTSARVTSLAKDTDGFCAKT